MLPDPIQDCCLLCPFAPPPLPHTNGRSTQDKAPSFPPVTLQHHPGSHRPS
ncbi:hypothetical protein GQ607_014343 [Colletotrichum asianum]|uniref:Uncharacterized protein n=1 Tax=Colletotrichum asianum TaxID=702518 RepID=A0A8H3W2T6_9PEZI|nr:hypothetical protein GQ607_014343 [Colletotrichum asianum]